MPRWLPPTSSTMSIGRCRTATLPRHADGGDGLGPDRPADGAAQAANNDSSTLDKTSLIGKIFIAFGALLTMASAARMFMA